MSEVEDAMENEFDGIDKYDLVEEILESRIKLTGLEATIAAQSEKIDLALIIIGEGKKNMCGEKICMSYLKDIKEALEGVA